MFLNKQGKRHFLFIKFKCDFYKKCILKIDFYKIIYPFKDLKCYIQFIYV